MSSDNRDENFDEINKTDSLSFLQADSNNSNDGSFDLSFQTSDKKRTSVYIPVKMCNDLNRISDVLDISTGYIFYKSYNKTKDYWMSRSKITGAINKFRSPGEEYDWVEDMIELIDYTSGLEFEMRVKKHARNNDFQHLIGLAESIDSMIIALENGKETSKIFRLAIENNYPDAKEILKDRLDTILDELGIADDWYD